MQPKTWRLKIGLVVNPYAGIGGEAGLKGSDGEQVRKRALAYSNKLHAPERVKQTLSQLQGYMRKIDWVAAQGLMGADYLNDVPCQIIETSETSSAYDTQRAVKKMMALNVDLILFAGGDGTARDIVDVVGEKIPCLGLPSGVKMQSEVFALSPIAAASLLKGLLSAELIRCVERDVRDIDEEQLRLGVVRSQYYGEMLVPDSPQYLQNLKQGGIESEPLVLDDIADYVADVISDVPLVLIGPGSTTAHVMQCMGFENTLVGFDAILGGKLLKNDVNAQDIVDLCRQYPDYQSVLSPTGRQGFLLGRGSQQLNRQLQCGMDKSHLVILATRAKLTAFNGRPLIVDTGQNDIDRALCGLCRVTTGFNDFVLYPVNTSYETR